ncbi:MAG: divergent PAP2 family protein [Turicibacter sp.]|nr:divergent PAP2 family protein [Turicibacter sp.]
MWFNYILETALIANISAQLLKIPIHRLMRGKWNPRLALSTGGMPSSHSATVSSLATAIGIVEGVHSPLFAIAFVVAGVVIYDAMGVRRHAGTHASMLNMMLDDLIENGDLTQFQDEKYTKRFKELLGHEPAETFFGALFGILVAFLYSSFVH